jgi:hypothetical protein
MQETPSSSLNDKYHRPQRLCQQSRASRWLPPVPFYSAVCFSSHGSSCLCAIPMGALDPRAPGSSSSRVPETPFVIHQRPFFHHKTMLLPKRRVSRFVPQLFRGEKHFVVLRYGQNWIRGGITVFGGIAVHRPGAYDVLYIDGVGELGGSFQFWVISCPYCLEDSKLG